MILIEPTSDGGAGAIVASARRSVVAVVAPGRGGSGFVALANGVVATTHAAVGFELDVALELDDGRTVAARVIGVDVPNDVALLLPQTPLGLAPFVQAAPSSARLGEPVVTLGRAPGGGLEVAAGLVSAELPCGGEHWLRTSASIATIGAVVLDREGRAVGLATRGPRALRHAGAAQPLVAPAGVLAALLASVDLPPAQLAERAPIYACPACAEPYDADDDRCLACGVLLPHAVEPSGERAAAERRVKEVLAACGVGANRVRSGARSWRFSYRAPESAAGAQVVVRLDRAGHLAAIRTPIARIPSNAPREALYRLLLTLDDRTTGAARLTVGDDDVIHLGLVASIDELGARDANELVARLTREAEHYRALLARGYAAEPLREADDPEPPDEA
jgi:hypothetical protein